jgi:CheY-like chemotaxis protein
MSQTQHDGPIGLTQPRLAPPGSLKVLLVEDEGMVAALIEDMLNDLGHQVVATAARMSTALETAKTATFDVAIIDINLSGEPSYALAELLGRRNIPYAFATGYGAQGVDPKFASVPTLQKPFVIADLQSVLARVQGVAHRDPAPPHGPAETRA